MRYPVRLLASATNISEPLFLKLEFTSGSIEGLSLAIEHITVSAVGSQREFDLNDKISLMDVPGSKFAKDVHYCRLAQTCAPFYESHTNPFTNAHPDQFSVEGRGYKACQIVANETNQDRWSFTPSTWVFGHSETLIKTMNIKVIARLVHCGDDTRRRGLRVQESVETVNVESVLHFEDTIESSKGDGIGIFKEFIDTDSKSGHERYAMYLLLLILVYLAVSNRQRHHQSLSHHQLRELLERVPARNYHLPDPEST